ncbi:hypothetical protein AVEN_18810-1 [Araneus ventricosus]|uniref:Uncharacterized protein n=1 Tax=Araneus ventricosus TaxID=182803 RepID=A0A4Y2PUD4_ARAVE|nr:hypothetical protein AVEN_18810-1 [Araneus ventricosus]
MTFKGIPQQVLDPQGSEAKFATCKISIYVSAEANWCIRYGVEWRFGLCGRQVSAHLNINHLVPAIQNYGMVARAHFRWQAGDRYSKRQRQRAGDKVG